MVANFPLDFAKIAQYCMIITTTNRYFIFSLDGWFPGSGWDTESDQYPFVQTALPNRFTRPGRPHVGKIIF
jgi:hypothetical protein